MCEPRQRGAYVSQKCGYNLPFPKDPIIDYCAHCLNGGTVAVVSAHLPEQGWFFYDPVQRFYLTGTRAGLCGDPYGRKDHRIGGAFMPQSRYSTVPIVKNYRTGSQVDFLAEIDTNHNGYFEFFLCNLDRCNSTDIRGKCFAQGHCYKLLRVKHLDCENRNRDTTYECGPVDENYPGRFYLPCRNPPRSGLQFVGGPSGTMRYQLPRGVRCKHCVIQWYWATANSCAPRGLLDYMRRKNSPFGRTCESDGGGRGTYRENMVDCGGKQVPEEFWSCADVQISDTGDTVGPVKLVPGVDVRPTDGGNQKEEDDKKTLDEAEDKINEQKKEGVQSKRDQWEEVRAKNGKCMRGGEPCDGGIECCGYEYVCAYTTNRTGFSCIKWWTLWEESETKERSHKAKFQKWKERQSANHNQG